MRPHLLESPPEVRQASEPVPVNISSSTLRTALLAFFAVFAAGFLALLLFWLGGNPRAGVPGLFDYAAATLGDGLLLPSLAFACVLALGWIGTPARAERGWAAAAAASGMAVAAAIQAVWLLDPSPHLNWTLVAPHELNTAGSWHTGFFVFAGGFFAGCVVAVGRRIRHSATEDQRRGLIESGWLATVTFCALGFLGLAAADNLAATETQAGVATGVGVALTAGLFALGAVWAFHRSARAIGRELLLGTGGAAGLTLLAAFGLEAPWGAALVGSLIAASLGVGANAAALASALESSPGMRLQLLIVAGIRSLLTALVLAGGLSLGLHLVGDVGLAAAIAVIAGSGLATLTARAPAEGPANAALRVTAAAYSVGLVVLAGWVSEGRSNAEANYAVGFATFFLDGLVLGMIREQFARVIRADVLGSDESGRKTEEVGADTLVQVASFGLAALAGLAALFAAAAAPLGLDVGTGFPDVDYLALAVALAVALVLTGASLVLAERADRERDKERKPEVGLALEVDGRALACALAGLTVWVGSLAWSVAAAGVEMAAVALIGAVAIGLMAAEDVVRSCARLQLHSPGTRGRVLASAIGVAVAAGVFFVLATGLWDGGKPASAAAAGVSLTVPLMTIFVAWLASSPLAFGLGAEKITPQTPSSNVLLIEFLYGALALVALFLPMIAISRITALDPSNTGLVAITSLAVLPPLIGAFVWILGNNTLHLELQLKRIRKSPQPPPPLNSFHSPQNTLSPTDRWLSWMSTHIRFQNRASIALMLTSFTWATLEILL